MTLARKISEKIETWKGPSTKSWSQCGEDRIASFYLEACGIKEGTYLDLGANHPTEFNNTYFFYQKGWRGFNVDPLEASIAAFNRSRGRDTNIHAGIGDTTTTRDFYSMQPSTLSTFHKDVADNYKNLGHAILAITPVQFLSVADLMVRYKIPADLDLLSVDIEGGELPVVRGLAAAGMRPKVLICETLSYEPDIRATKKNKALIDAITQLGFIVYGDTYLNTIFIDQIFWETGKSKVTI